ncbi:MAG: HD domain-containing phosphohydrolase [Sulfurisoma sp.]|nr:HD domain-containing phosphohydrolase [Sulfurisoma sp.]
MADITALLNPRIADRESLEEFIDDLTDKVPGIERNIALLKRAPRDRELIANLFRALHNIKGDSALCKVDVGVLIAHPIETLLARVRNDEIVFTDLLAEVTLLALDRLELAVEALSGNRPLGHLKLVELVGGLDGMATLAADEIDARAFTVIESVTGFRPAPAARPPKQKATRGREAASEDLKFFRTLALQFEARSKLYKGRAARLLRLALDTNIAAGSPVDATQLEAAVHLHDIGMMMLPEAVWLKPGKLSDDDKKSLHAHPGYSAGLLERMPGWADAAAMVAQHHEMPDGGGYPLGIKEAAIHPGAKIIAIVDAFEAVMQKHSDRGHSRSLLRAIAEVNACDNQFAPEWIEHFNAVVRKRVEA